MKEAQQSGLSRKQGTGSDSHEMLTGSIAALRFFTFCLKWSPVWQHRCFIPASKPNTFLTAHLQMSLTRTQTLSTCRQKLRRSADASAVAFRWECHIRTWIYLCSPWWMIVLSSDLISDSSPFKSCSTCKDGTLAAALSGVGTRDRLQRLIIKNKHGECLIFCCVLRLDSWCSVGSLQSEMRP